MRKTLKLTMKKPKSCDVLWITLRYSQAVWFQETKRKGSKNLKKQEMCSITSRTMVIKHFC